MFPSTTVSNRLNAKDRTLLIANNHLKNADINSENKMLITKFIHQLAAEGLTKDRLSKYIYTTVNLSRWVHNKSFRQLIKDDIVTVVGNLNAKEYSEWTKRDYRIVLKRLLKYVQEQEGKIYQKYEYPPEVAWLDCTVKKSRKKLPKELLSIDDIKRLSEGTLNLRDKAFILFLYESGGRIGEVLNIRLKDLSFDKYGVLVDLMGKTGSRKIRVIASAPALSNWIKHHPRREDKNGWLFCSINHTSLGVQGEYRYFNKLLVNAKKRVNLDKPVNPHHFRHSRATELAKKLTEAQLCTYMGWGIGSKEAATYVHLSGRDTDQAILAIHGLVKEETEKETFSPITCPRCSIQNSPGSKFCSGCSLGFDLKSLMEMEKDAKGLGFSLMDLMKDPNFLVRFGNLLAEEYEKLKK